MSATKHILIPSYGSAPTASLFAGSDVVVTCWSSGAKPTDMKCTKVRMTRQHAEALRASIDEALRINLRNEAEVTAPVCLCGTGGMCPRADHRELLANPIEHNDNRFGPREDCQDCHVGRHR